MHLLESRLARSKRGRLLYSVLAKALSQRLLFGSTAGRLRFSFKGVVQDGRASRRQRRLANMLRRSRKECLPPSTLPIKMCSGRPFGGLWRRCPHLGRHRARQRVYRAWMSLLRSIWVGHCRLRKLALQCLAALDLSDARSLPALVRLQSLIDSFEFGSHADVSTARSGKQWQQLRSIAAGAALKPSAGPSVADADSREELARRIQANPDRGLQPDCNFNDDRTPRRVSDPLLNACSPGDSVSGSSSKTNVQQRGQCTHGLALSKCPECVKCRHGKRARHCAACNGCEHGRLLRNCTHCRSCPHGKLKHFCAVCTPCPHGKVKRSCVLCSGCPHGKPKQDCINCGGCQHGRPKRNCVQCSGCVHGKMKHSCAHCNPCPHGRAKNLCAECTGCPHGKMKQNCKVCKSCPHGKLKKICLVCCPCPHGRVRQTCPTCSGCEHGKRKAECGICRPCPHGRIKPRCVDCTGCPHGKVKKVCRDCSGCPHGKLRHNCGVCSGCAHGKPKSKCRQCKKPTASAAASAAAAARGQDC
mmetsp:Transcript_8168/g.29699  ORF Transcript_8168/g.29699 Transcript_8168/m.29699 type:complete len:529 (+) Transcript_8168:360-1946(+)